MATSRLQNTMKPAMEALAAYDYTNFTTVGSNYVYSKSLWPMITVQLWTKPKTKEEMTTPVEADRLKLAHIQKVKEGRWLLLQKAHKRLLSPRAAR